MAEVPENGDSSRVGRGPAGEGQRVKIRERSFAFSLRAIKLFQHLQKQKDGTGWVIGKQFLRSACSVGANVEEAQSAESRADFIHKLGIAQKEARETLYWLCLQGGITSCRHSKTEPSGERNRDNNSRSGFHHPDHEVWT